MDGSTVGYDWRADMRALVDGASADPDEVSDSHLLHTMAGLDQLEIALAADAVTFHEVARAWFGIHDDALPSHFREVCLRFFGRLYENFTTRRGGIESGYFCEHIRIAAVLTDIDRAAELPAAVRRAAEAERADNWLERHRLTSASAIHIEPLLGHPQCAESKRVLSRSLDLHYRALEVLRPQHRQVCLRRIFSTVTALLGTLDERAAGPGHSPGTCLTTEEAARFHGDLDEAEAYYAKHAERRAQVEYLLGMGGGFAAILAIVGLATFAKGVTVHDTLIVSLFAGALGAIVSVMTRVKSGTLELERETGTTATMILGGIRPFLGAVFGGLLYVLIQGGVIVSGVPDDATYVTYAGLAFVAGFTERVANGVIDTAAEKVAGKSKGGRPASASGV
jgi:hypothetical protein